MPKFYARNKKRIDPRYFLNETALPGNDPMELIGILSTSRTLICDNKDKFLLAINHLPSGIAADAIIRATGLPAEAQGVLQKLIEIYQANEEAKEPMESAVETLCGSLKIPKLPFPLEEGSGDNCGGCRSASGRKKCGKKINGKMTYCDEDGRLKYR